MLYNRDLSDQLNPLEGKGKNDDVASAIGPFANGSAMQVYNSEG